MPLELQEAFEQNNLFKQIMSVPDKVMGARRIQSTNTESRFRGPGH